MGSYTINAGALANGNYLITANNGTLSITPYTPNPATFLNGQTPAGLSGTVQGFVSGDTLANETTGTLDAGNYVIVQASGQDTPVLSLLASTLPQQVVSTVVQLVDSVPSKPPVTGQAQDPQQQQQLPQQSPSNSPTDFKGLGIVGPGVKLPPTLIASAL